MKVFEAPHVCPEDGRCPYIQCPNRFSSPRLYRWPPLSPSLRAHGHDVVCYERAANSAYCWTEGEEFLVVTYSWEAL